MDRRLIISWATIRAKMFTKTYEVWKRKASTDAVFITNAGVNTVAQKEEIEALNPNDPNLNVFALGDNIKGVPTANYKLLSAFEFKDSDIIIIGADDFDCPKNWDLIIRDCFENYDGSIIFEDGNPERMRPIITIPILTGRLLKKLNGIVYHPAYKHNYADNEFYLNVTELGEVVDLRTTKPDIIFEHRHWLFNKRPRDRVDTYAITEEGNDHITWDIRKTWPIAERLKV
jgi:hypothetical protein